MKQTNVVTQVTINAKPAAVFKYLKDLKYHYLWNPHLIELSPLIKLKTGASYKTVSYVLGKNLEAVNHVTVFKTNQELELQNNTGTVHYSVNYRLLPKGRQTQVVCSTKVSSDSAAFAFTKTLLAQLAKRELQTDLQALKLAVEHQLESF